MFLTYFMLPDVYIKQCFVTERPRHWSLRMFLLSDAVNHAYAYCGNIVCSIQGFKSNTSNVREHLNYISVYTSWVYTSEEHYVREMPSIPTPIRKPDKPWKSRWTEKFLIGHWKASPDTPWTQGLIDIKVTPSLCLLLVGHWVLT